MTDQEWTASTDPAAMLAWMGKVSDRSFPGVNLPASDRKLRLWIDAVGCDGCRLLAQGRPLAFWADSVSKCVSCKSAEAKVRALRDIFGNPFRPIKARPEWLSWNGGVVRQLAERIYQESLWADHGICNVLADALEEAGCPAEEACPECRRLGLAPMPREDQGHIPCPDCRRTDRIPSPLLAHLRSPGPHVRGCWVIDLLTGRS